MDSTKRDNKEVQGKLMALQKEKDQVQQIAFPFGPSPILWRLISPEHSYKILTHDWVD